MTLWNRNTLAAWAAAAVFGLAGTATAEETDGLFDQLDADGDGVITKDEIGEERQRFFDRLLRVGDRDNDGKLSRSEYDAALQPEQAPSAGMRDGDRRPGGMDRPRLPSPEEAMQTLDKNNDGKIARDELTDRARMLGGVMDRMGKDELTLEDLKTLRERMQQMGGRGRPEMSGGGDSGDRMNRLRQLDADGDGVVSREEIPEQVKDRLAPMLERMGGEINLAQLEMYTGRMRPGGPPERDARPDGPPPGGVPKLVRMLDADNDGAVSKLEAVSLIEKFAEFDADGDGKLQPHELLGPPPADPASGGERPMADRGSYRGRGDSGMRRDGDRPPQRDPQAFFKRMDKDGDGKLSGDELPPFMKSRLESLDKDGDGAIAADELRRPGR